MPNLKSSKKRIRQDEKRRVINVARKTALKTAVKKVLVAVDNKEVVVAQEMLSDAQAQLARAAGKGVLHKNTAARKMSRLARRVAKMKKAATAA